MDQDIHQSYLSREAEFSGANGDTGEKQYPLYFVQLTVSRIGNYTRWVLNLLNVMVIHTSCY